MTRNTPYWNNDNDQMIGSVLESWVNRDTGEYCRFCADVHVGDVESNEKFCSDECRERFDQVFDARLAIGKRDIDLRGYD